MAFAIQHRGTCVCWKEQDVDDQCTSTIITRCGPPERNGYIISRSVLPASLNKQARAFSDQKRFVLNIQYGLS